MTSAEEYQAKADEALTRLGEAKSESERQQLRRAHGAYLKLATHGAEAAARSAMRPPPKPRPEKQAPSAPPGASYFK
jgi:hypothetical protein